MLLQPSSECGRETLLCWRAAAVMLLLCSCVLCCGHSSHPGLLLAAEAETSRGARERAGVISSFALMVGLSVGSASGLLISKTVAASS